MDWARHDHGIGGRARMARRRMVFVVLGLALTHALAGCSGGGGAGPAPVGTLPPLPPAPPPPVIAADLDGRYVGTVTIDGREYFGDALITIDGEARLYIGDPYSPTGALQLARPESSAQFVGTLGGRGDAASGAGVIIGQQCAVTDSSRFCGASAPAEISVAVTSGDLTGEIRVVTNKGNETWLLDLGSWDNYYEIPASHGTPAGQLQESLAEFAIDNDVIVNVDQAGRIFFQGANAGCTGNGAIAAHLDGEVNVYDVTLTIESCIEPYDYLNGEFAGLATTTASSYWDYDFLLRVWLSSSNPSSGQAAVTMLGLPL